MLFPVLSAGVVNSVVFGVYGNTKRLIHAFRSDNDTDDVRFCCDAQYPSLYWHLDVFTAGCVAGTFYAAINTPIEVVKMTLQLTSNDIRRVIRQKLHSVSVVTPTDVYDRIALCRRKNTV